LIVARIPGSALLVTQSDHARLAADLLSLMRLPALVGHPRRERLLRAVAEHDNGWRESDAAPRFDPSSGLPVDFRAVAAADRAEIWRRGVERHAADDPYVAALVAGHALRLLGAGERLSVERRELLTELGERRDELAQAAGVAPGELVDDDRWLRFGDELALVGATGDPGFFAFPGYRLEARADAERTAIVLTPLPLAGATSFSVAARRLPDAAPAAIADAARRLATASWERRVVHLRAGD
jgi:hypothetical protein